MYDNCLGVETERRAVAARAEVTLVTEVTLEAEARAAACMALVVVVGMRKQVARLVQAINQSICQASGKASAGSAGRLVEMSLVARTGGKLGVEPLEELEDL